MGSAPRTPVPHVCRDMVQWDGGAGAVIAQCWSPLFPNQTWKRVRTGITAERGKWGWFFFPHPAPLASLAYLCVCPHEVGVQGDVELGESPVALSPGIAEFGGVTMQRLFHLTAAGLGGLGHPFPRA